MATSKAPKLGTPVNIAPIVLTDENPDDYVGDRYVQVAAPVAPQAPSSGLIRRVVGDGLVTAVKGAIGVPEAVVGLADIATGGRVGKALENEGGAVGFRPKQARDFLDTLYSPEQQAAFREVQQAADPNAPLVSRIVDTGAAALRNPSTIAHAIGESLPSMGAGGVLARGLTAVAPRAAGWAAAGIGEGAVAAGAGAERVRQETKDGLLTPEQTLIAAGSGAATAGIGMVAGRVAQKLGIGDVDVLLAGGKAVPQDVQKGFVRRVLEGAFSEGVLEELPQSVQEQVAQNYALGKPLDEGVDIAAVMGVLSGGAMGFGVNAMPRQKVPEVGPLSRAANVAGTGGVPAAVPPVAPVAPAAPTAPVAPAAPIAPAALPPLDDQAAIARMERENQRLQAEASGRARAADDNGQSLGVVSGAPRAEPAPEPAAPVLEDIPFADQNDILNPKGEPFKTAFAARRRLAELPEPRAYQVAQVQGGFALRRMAEQGDGFKVGQTWGKAGVSPYTITEVSEDGKRARARFGRNESAWVELATERSNGWAVLGGEPTQAAQQEAGDGAGPRADGAAGEVAPDSAGGRAEPAGGAGAVPADGVGRVGGAAGSVETSGGPAAAVADAQPKRADALKPAEARIERPGATAAGATIGPAPIEQRPAGARSTGAADVLAKLQKGGNVASDPIAGDPIDAEWTAFKPESGTKGVATAVGATAPSAEVPAQSQAGGTPAEGPGDTRATAAPAPASAGDPEDIQNEPAALWWGVLKRGGHLTKPGREQALRAVSLAPDLHNGTAWWHIGKDRRAKLRALFESGWEPTEGARPSAAADPEGSPEARWTRSTEAERIAALAKAGWSVSPPSQSTQKVLRTAWVDLTQSQRDRIGAAMDGAEPAPKESALERIKRLKTEREQAPAVVGQADKDGNTIIGRRADGVMIRADKRGVRWYAEGGARIFETVTMRPTRAGMEIARGELKPEFMTAEELAASRPEPDAIKASTTGAEIPAGERQANQQPQASANTIFTEDAAEKARAILKRKLGQLSSGIDPEILQAGITLAGYHIERGARTFAAYAKAMVADLGEGVRPYLKSWYMGVKYDPRAAAFQDGMSSAAEVESADIEQASAEEPAPADDGGKPSLDGADGRRAVAQSIADRLIGGDGFDSITEARKFIGELTGRKIEPGTRDAKLADETVENAVVLAGRDIVRAARRQGRSDEVIYERLVSLYKAQPNLSVRSSTSVREQAYSTPAPLAFLASRLARVKPDSRVGEPTAGNGMLMIEVEPENAVVNELNADRAANLRALGFGPTTNNAATADLAPAKSLDAEIMNPPFGATKDDERKTVNFDVLPGYSTYEIDHAIAFQALRAMKDDGNAVLILGGIDESDPERIRDGYRGKTKREFYYHLYQGYRVVDHFTVDGGLYARQGAGYPVDVVVIRGRGKATRDLPAADLPRRFDSWESLKEKLNADDSVVPAGDGPVAGSGDGAARGTDRGGVVDGAGRQADGNGAQGAGPRGSGNAGSTNAGDARAGEPRADGRNGVPAQPGAANRNDTGRDGAAQSVPGEGRDGQRGSRAGNAGNQSDGLAGAGQLDGQRVQSGLTDRRGQEQETATQVAYAPRSGAASVGTLVPVNMRDAIQASLDRVQAEVGGLDKYVADALGMDAGDIGNYFSAEQVDALALAVYNAEQDSGFIIGDQTGIGKGRVVAGMIRYAINKGKTPIFVTEKPNLYADMIRDLDDIGMSEALALEGGNPAILMTNGDENVPYSLQRKVGDEIVESTFELKPAAKSARSTSLASMVEQNSLGRFKIIFTTYNQLQTVKGKSTDRMRLVQHFGDGGYMIFDESHNAGGNDAGQARSKSQRKQQAAGETLVTGRAAFVRGLVRNSGGSFFSSATYAKRPDVMDLYSSTNMMLAVNKPADLGPAIKSGGVPMQQIVATMLTEDGQYIRRERTFAGVSYETRTMKVDRKTAENMATAMRRILEFSRAKEAAVKAMQKEADREAAMVRVEGEKTQVQGANFGSIMHNLIDQMLLSLKSKDSVEFAIERLKAGEKVVLTVSNTMGSFLKDYADQMELRAGEPVALTFKDLYARYLDKQRWVKIKRPNGIAEDYRLTDDDLGPAVAAMYRDIEQFLDGAGFGEAPISPIDYMHAELRKAGFKTDEITGRTITLSYDSGIPKLAGRQATIKQRLAAIRGFNGGSIDALILNQSGSTGLSLHASAKVKDKRKRRMIVVQAEKNIDTHMQMLGRVHRTGQVLTPDYTQAMADIPAETRPAAVLLKKMASLNANTTASRTSAVTADGVVDFMNDYGGQVAHEFLMDNPEIHQAIGGKAVLAVLEDPSEATEDDIRKLTGYIPILPIEQQEQVYADLIDRYNDLIARETAMGTNKLEARALDLDAKTVSAETLTERKDGNSRFAAPAVMERVDVKRTVKPMSGQEVVQAIADSLDGKSGRQKTRELLRGAEDATEAYRRSRIEALTAAGADPARIARETDTINLQLGQVRAILLGYPVSTPVAITDKNGTLTYGVVTDIADSKKTKNPVAGSSWKMTLALANGDARSLTLTFGQIGTAVNLRSEPGEVLTFKVSPDGNVVPDEYESATIMSLFDRGANVRRERRWMVTGNILAGYARHPGQIVNYTKNDGTIGQGVLMARTFDFNKIKNNAPAEFSTLDQIRQFFRDAKGSAIIGTKDGVLRITLLGNGGMDFVAPSSKREGGTYFLDAGLTRAIGMDFYKANQVMRARVQYEEDAYAGIRYLLEQRDDVRLVALTNIPVARKVLGIGEPAAEPPAAMSRQDGAGSNASPTPTGGMPTERVEALAREIAKTWPNAPEIVVVPTITDESVPQDIRDYMMQSMESGADAGDPNGFFDTQDGKVYLIADKLPDEAAVVRVLMHETLGHYGMRAIFGKEFGAMLDRMTMLNASKVRAAARQLGYDFDKPSERRMAAEEVLAYMAQETPELGWVQRAVAAIRTWAREHIPRFRELALSDAEIIRDFILPARRFVAGRGPGGGGSRSTAITERAMFSRPMAQALDGAINSIRDVRLPAGYVAGDFISQNAGKLHWWHKTVGTMFHLAERSPHFKRVYDGVQSFLNDVSLYATEAADLAPRILPKLDKFSDVWKSPLSPEDTKAIARPIFEGTLTWGRDSKGRARPMDEIEADMLAEITDQPLREGATDDERLTAKLHGMARLLLREGKVTPEVLRMWQGQTLERYQSIIEGKFERELMTPGVVFSPAELREHFSLTDDQVQLYQEFRAATDRSLSDLTTTGMLRLAGRDGDAVRDLVLGAGDVQRAADVLSEKLRELADKEPERADYLNDLSNQVLDKAQRARDLMDRGYAPLSRFGTYTLDVLGPGGERLYFGLFESRGDRAKMARALASEHPGAAIEQGTMSQEAFKLFAGISPETAELFGEMLGLDAQGDDAKSQAFQEYLKKARSNRDAVKRLIKRKGIAGFSEDAGRVLAGFVYSNARQSAASLHMGEIDQAVDDIPRSQGELKDEAVKLREYVKNPQEEAATFRAVLFAQYLGGSIASAMVNATQPLAVTLPYLSQWGGPTKAGKRMASAVRDATRSTTGDSALDGALKRAEDEGIVAPQEVHSLMAQAMGKAQLRSGDGTRLGDAAAMANNTLSRVSLAWGKVFSVAELFNRRTTFIAAYRTAMEEGMADPAKFAEKAVAETQFTYNKGNKPRWARGLAGSVLFTFKQYSVNYVELLHRMATAGEPGSAERRAGQQAALLALAVLFLMAGADGLPFAEDVQDVVDAAVQRLGYNVSTKQKLREVLASALGKGGADFVMNGVTGIPGVPIDVSGHLGMGNLLPGTGLLVKKADHTRDLMELAGPGGDFAKRAFTAAGELATGNVATAARTISPTAARNVIQAIDMASTGAYRDERGRKVIDTDLGDALAKGIGFQPGDVKDVQDASREVQRMKAQYQLAQAEFREKLARGIAEDDRALQAEARADLASWNAKNPTMRLSGAMPAVLARVREMRKTKAQRVADTAPKAIRGLAREQMAEGV